MNIEMITERIRSTCDVLINPSRNFFSTVIYLKCNQRADNFSTVLKKRFYKISQQSQTIR